MNNNPFQLDSKVKKKKHTGRNILIVCTCFLCLFVWFHQESEISSYHADSAHRTRIARKYNHKRKYLTVAKIRKEYDKKEPNLSVLLKNNNKQLSHALHFGFNIKNRNKYKAKEYLLQQNLGMSFTDSLNKIVMPNFSSKYSNIASNNKLLSQRLNYYNVSYGEYDSDEKTIPFNVHVSFMTPSFSDSITFDSHKYPHNAGLEINGTLFIHSRKMQINHYYISIHKRNR